jgi:hypothetical protein
MAASRVLTADWVALLTADALRRQALPIVGPGASWGPRHGRRRWGDRAMDGAGPLGLERRDRNDRQRRSCRRLIEKTDVVIP